MKSNSKRKVIALMMAMMLLVGAAVGGTVAWLATKTQTVTNTFTTGDIDITLKESANLDLKMIPGKTITKDPTVTVLKGSEACWLFVKVEKSSNFDTFMTYTMASGWEELSGSNGVYYRQVAATTSADAPFDVVKDNKVTVLNTVTKANFNALTEETYPMLKFTAYAVQQEGFTTAAAAWTEAQNAAANSYPTTK